MKVGFGVLLIPYALCLGLHFFLPLTVRLSLTALRESRRATCH